ncbi:PadR family transcriptional regulator [Leucobacter sp. wl10]|uniref:PadR family transcriptional regulator n=1 Tax=Leucobacter sp. wl10 TaxID=2304677 RepID=UPI000E5A37FC|nr:helix-turn-helix transcriptional regulator [Leucobacter sp. wl10]RGE21456.1 PadR family transcriptional regulator [Leucobacter sp. wl10]
MLPLPRLTPATSDALAALLAHPEPVWGLLIVKESGRPAGSIYPILERLERLGWVTSEWEAESERSGPRRRLYRLTSDGAIAAREAVQRFQEQARPRLVGAPSEVIV